MKKKTVVGANPVLLFDGVCNLCNSSVQVILKRDKGKIFRFAALQSEYGRQLIDQFPTELKNIDSVVLKEGSTLWFKSDAVLRVLWHLGGWYRILYGFKIVPRFVRDALYDWIAGHRYSWFGRQDTCMVPTPELKNRFLD